MDEQLYENQVRTTESQGWQQYPGQSPYPGSDQYPGWHEKPDWDDRYPGMEHGRDYGTDRPEQKNYMALASMIMGILSIVTACCFLPGVALGGMAVIFAALSRVEERLCGRGKAGLITGIIGIAAGFASAFFWLYLAA